MENLRRHISYWIKTADPGSRKRGGGTMVQQLRKSITTLAFLAISAASLAQAPTAPLTLKPDAPDRYVVVPGDTLWGISQRYTDSPWRWPELWNMNREQIRNPHLIYPVYVLVLDRERGQLTIAQPGTPGGTPQARDGDTGAGTDTGTPTTSAPTTSAPSTTTTSADPGIVK